MEIAFTIAIILLLLFAVLGFFDGFYLHIFKYKLHEHPQSKTEHLTHTLRAILFPGILYFLYILNDCTTSFFIGMSLVFIDIIILAVDAYIEKDSRAYLGGLPRWEYILHLFVNGFHMASVAVFLIIKLTFTNGVLQFRPGFTEADNYPLFMLVVVNVLPGAILLAVLHVLVMFPVTLKPYNKLRAKITCC